MLVKTMTVHRSLNDTILFFFHLQANKMKKKKYKGQKDIGLHCAHVDRLTMVYLYNLVIDIVKKYNRRKKIYKVNPKQSGKWK